MKGRKILNMTSPGDISPKDRYNLIWQYLDNDKAEDIASYDLTGKSPLADYMIIATGRSSSHLKSLADNIQRKLASENIKGIRFEGQNMGDWIIVDAGDVIVHLFRQEVRDYYDLDKLWQECAIGSPLPSMSALSTGGKVDSRESLHL